MKPMTALLLSVLLLTVTGCASQSPDVIALPQPARPQVPSSLMERETSSKSSYQTRLSGVFATSQKMPTER